MRHRWGKMARLKARGGASMFETTLMAREGECQLRIQRKQERLESLRNRGCRTAKELLLLIELDRMILVVIEEYRSTHEILVRNAHNIQMINDS
jgi:hypothetical protein